MDIGYARVSTLDQNPGLQLDALARAGCAPIFEERVTGVAKSRLVRDQALAQLRAGDTLTVWALDRLGRSTSETLAIVRGLDEHGIRFRCLTQPVDTSSAMGKMFIGFLAVMAEFERELLRERVLAGKARMKAEGRHTGGPSLFGFERDHETINEEQATLVREACRRVLDQGETLSKVVEDWNLRDLRPGKATRWRVSYLREILINPQTAAIVGDQEHERLLRLFAGRSRQRLGRPAEHLLSGILACARCDQPLYGTWKQSRSGVREMYYRCKKASGSGGRFSGCGSTGVTMARADTWSREAFIAAVCSEDFAQALNRRQAELLAGEVTVAELDDWRAEIADIEQVLPTRFANDQMRRRHEQLQRMVREATTRLLQRPDLQALVDLPKSEEQLRAAWGSWTVGERRSWLKRVFERIVVKPATVRGRGSDVESRLDPVWIV
jgi:DNA invertase Pin-like site-specific DNA recombinase